MYPPPPRALACFALAVCGALLAGPILHAADAGTSPLAAARQQRADLLRNEIKTIDGRIESRIGVIVDGLSGIADSKDSRTKVARIKEATIDALAQNVQLYRTKRDQMREQLRRPTANLTTAQKQKILDALNSRIERRVAQIIEIQKSLPTHKDYERYKVVGSNWVGPEYARNEDYDQNRRVTQYTSATQKKVLDGLDASITNLNQQNRTLQASLASASDPAQHQALTAEIARNDALITERRQQRLEVLQPADKATRAAGRNEVANLDDAIRKAASDLRFDVTTLFARYNAYLQALSELNTTHAAKPA